MPSTHSVPVQGAAALKTQIPQLSPVEVTAIPARVQTSTPPTAATPATSSTAPTVAAALGGITLGAVIATAVLSTATGIAVSELWNRIKKRF